MAKKRMNKPKVGGFVPNPGLEELRLTINSQGWKNVVEPTLAKNVMVTLNTLASPKRPEGESDDYLRGRISAFREIASVFAQHVERYDNEKLTATTAPTPERATGSPYEEDALSELSGEPEKDS